MQNLITRIKGMKRSTMVILAVLFVSITIGTVFAITSHFAQSDPESSDIGPAEFFDVKISNVFPSKAEVGPGGNVSVNPVVTSVASSNSYVFILVDMPKYGSGGLYTVNNNGDWSLEESWSSGG